MCNQLHQKCRVLVLLAAVGLALLQFSANSQAGPLDRYSENQLRGWLLDELNDIYRDCQISGPNEEVDIDKLHECIMDELSDAAADRDSASPAHREAHKILTMDALEKEMKEAGTTLSDVVMEALEEADRVASRDGSRGLTRLARVDSNWAMPLSESSGTGAGPLAIGPNDRRPPAGVAVKFVAQRVAATIKKI